MKNLKKALVLVLAFAMIFGLFTINASAASFNDDADIVNKEAVATMSELGIINGYEDGTFLPKQVVTRAEMCKMICVALNGGIAPVLDTGTAVFSDTKGHWASAYINYCFAKGIVSGDSGKGGPFRPDATVTALEAAKMMLVALGYNAQIAGFTGPDWAQNVAIAANEKNLFDGIGALNVTAGLSRDNAAQLIYNGLFAGMVKYENVLTTDANGNLVSTPRMVDDTTTGGAVKTILSDKFKVSTDYGQLVEIGKETVKIKLDSSLGNSASTGVGGYQTYTKVGTDYTALLGQSVKVMFKSTDKVLGVVPLSKNTVVSTNERSVTMVSATKVKFGGTEYTLDVDASNRIEVLTITANGAVLSSQQTASQLTTGKSASYNAIKFVDNDGDNKYEYAVITEYVPAKVTYASSTEVIANSTTYKYADHVITGSIAKDDYITIVGNPFKANSKITKVDVSIGKVTGYKSTTTEYQIDNGTWYKAANALAGITPGDSIKYVAVNGLFYYTAKTDSSTSLSGVVMVVDADATGLNRNAKILRADGTKAVVAIDTTSQGAVDPYGGGSGIGKLYTYTVTDYGYKFKNAENIGNNTLLGSGTVANNGTTNLIEKISNVEIADDAIIFVWNGQSGGNGDGKVITGKQLRTLTAGTHIDAASIDAYRGTSNGLTRIVMAAVKSQTAGTLPSVGGDANKYALVVEASYQIDSEYITYKIWTGSSVETVKEKNITTRAAKTLIAYSSIVDGVIKDVTVPSPTNAYVAAVVGDYVYLNGDSDATNKYNITNKTVVLYYDSSATKADEIGKPNGSIVPADKVKVGGTDIYTENVKYVASGKDITVLLVDVKNNLNDGTAYSITGATQTVRPNLTVTATAPANAQAGDVVTVTLTATGSAITTAQEVKVVYGGQTAFVTLPASGAASSVTATVTFVQPASTVTISLPKEVIYNAVTPVATAVNGITATGTVAAGRYYEGDTVTITVTTAGTATGNVTLTLTGTTTGLATVSPASGSGITKNTSNFVIADTTDVDGKVFTFTVTAKDGEDTPAISLS